MSQLTAEQAMAIINSKKEITKAEDYKLIEVSSVSFADSDGNAFIDEATQLPYAIVNFKAISKHQLEQAEEAFVAGDYDKAANYGMSMRERNLDRARSLGRGSRGTLVVNTYTNKDGVDNCLGVLNFIPAVAVEAGKVDLAARIAARQAAKAATTEQA